MYDGCISCGLWRSLSRRGCAEVAGRHAGMTTPDLINGLFELTGGLLNWGNVIRLYRDKQVRGVYVPAWALFTLWGFWNLYYYPHLNQWMSFAGGLVIVTANTVWVALAGYYRERHA